MPIIKIQVSQNEIARLGRIPKIGETFVTDQGEQGVVAMSFPEINDPNILIDVPEQVTPLDLASSAQIVDARCQHEDYKVLWLNPRTLAAEYTPEGEWHSLEYDIKHGPGDTFDLCGATKDVREAANEGDGIFVCCVDTGVDHTHEVFQGYDLVMWSNGEFGTAPDGHGHGTFCLSEIGGKCGMAPRAKIGMFQGLPGAGGGGSELTVATAIRAAADYLKTQNFKFSVVSMSLGGSSSSVIKAATSYLLQVPNIVVCCAAGNSGPRADIGSPADTPGVVVVGSCSREMKLSDFSSGGGDDERISCYHVGEKIVGAQRGGGYMSSDGTSMATPEVAGEAVLHGAKGRTAKEVCDQISSSRQVTLRPPAKNGKGFQILHRGDFLEDAPAQPPAITQQPPSDGTTVAQSADPLQEVITRLNDARFRLGQGRDDAAATVEALKGVMTGADAQIAQALGIIATFGPDQPPPGGSSGGEGPILPGPIPTPMPAVPGAFTKHYADGAQQYFNLIVPPDAIDLPLVVLWHGGGWLMGDPDDTMPLDTAHVQWSLDFLKPLLERFGLDHGQATVEELTSEAYMLHVLEVSRWFLQQGIVLATPAYAYGVGPALQDAYSAVSYIAGHAREYGANPTKLVLVGHSAGGHLAMMAAANPDLPRPAAVVTMAAAGLYLTGTDKDGVPEKSAAIFDQVWGTIRKQWPQFSPHTRLLDRTPRQQNVAVIQGSQDDQLNPTWAIQFVNDAKRAGWGCDLVMQQGGDHFSVANPTTNARTAQVLRQVIQQVKGAR